MSITEQAFPIEEATEPAHPIYNVRFALVCLSSLLFSASFNMLIPELPAYLSSLGGAEYKGLIIALFTLTAGLSRPFSGRLTDAVGRVPVMAVGSLVCVVCGVLYPLLASVSGFLLLRLVHGFSTGFKPTATAAYVADIVPRERWGEALGLHGLFFSTGMALGPAVGGFIALHFSLDVLFYASSAFALLSVVILLNVRETLAAKRRFRFSDLKISRRDVFAGEVFPAAVVTFLSYLSYGAVLTLVPDWSRHLGVANKGLFFVVFTVASLFVRLLAGRASDAYGRTRVVTVGLVLLIASLFAIGYAASFAGLMTGAALYGFAVGVLSPATNAWTVDLSDPAHRGRALATMYIALEAGIGLGALAAGSFYLDEIARVPAIMYASAGVTATALAYMLLASKKRPAGSR